MKKTILLLAILGFYLTSFGQAITSKNPLPLGVKPAAAISTEDILRMDGRYETVFMGNSTLAFPISLNQNVIAFSSVYKTGGFNFFLQDIAVMSNKTGVMNFQINNLPGIQANALNVNLRFNVKAGEVTTIPYGEVIPWGATVNITYISTTDVTGTLDLYAIGRGYKFSQTGNIFAPLTILGIGDSIMESAASTNDKNNPNLSWFMQYVDYYRKVGYNVKPVNKAIGGLTATNIAVASRNGYLHASNANLITICLGMNYSATLSDYLNDITEIVNWVRADYPRARILVLNPPVTTDAPREAILVTYRAALPTLVATLNAQSPSLIPVVHVPFNTYYTTSDLSGDGVHPTQVGHDKAATGMITNFGPSLYPLNP